MMKVILVKKASCGLHSFWKGVKRILEVMKDISMCAAVRQNRVGCDTPLTYIFFRHRYTDY